MNTATAARDLLASHPHWRQTWTGNQIDIAISIAPHVVQLDDERIGRYSLKPYVCNLADMSCECRQINCWHLLSAIIFAHANYETARAVLVAEAAEFDDAYATDDERIEV